MSGARNASPRRRTGRGPVGEVGDPDALVMSRRRQASAAPRQARLRGRTFRIGLPRSRRGVFGLLLVVGAFAFPASGPALRSSTGPRRPTSAGAATMGPRAVAYETGPAPRRHLRRGPVERGSPLVSGQAEGTRQLIQVLTGLYRSHPPPRHDALPSTKDTCQVCHSLDRLASSALVARTSFSEDEANTRAFVASYPPGSATPSTRAASTGMSCQHVEFRFLKTTPRRSTTSPTLADGTVEEFISQDISRWRGRPADIDAIKASEKPRTMDCIQSTTYRASHPEPRKGMDATSPTSGSTRRCLTSSARECGSCGTASGRARGFAEAEKLSSFSRSSTRRSPPANRPSRAANGDQRSSTR